MPTKTKDLWLPSGVREQIDKRLLDELVNKGGVFSGPDGEPYQLVRRDALPPAVVNEGSLWQYHMGLEKGLGPNVPAGMRPRPIPEKQVEAFRFMDFYAGIKTPQGGLTLTPNMLRGMVRRVEPLGAVVNYYITRSKGHGKLPENRYDTGFEIRMRDKEGKATKAATARMKQISDAMLRCGFAKESAPNAYGCVEESDEFPEFLAKLVRDSLIMDHAAFVMEVGTNAQKYPRVWWKAVDAAKIRLVAPEWYKNELLPTNQVVKYVKVDDSQGVAIEYTSDSLGILIRNPQTDERFAGYGMSETEQCINAITSYLNAATYNRSSLTTNSVPPGILALIGQQDQATVEQWHAQWSQQLRGAANQFRTPVIALKPGMAGQQTSDIKWVPLRQWSNRDMEYHQWLSFQITVICSIFGVEPEQIGVAGWSPSGRSPLSEASPQVRIEKGEDRGYKPVMAALASCLNKNLIWKIDPDFMLAWVGLDPVEEQAELQRHMQYLNMGVKTIGSVRDELDIPRTGDKYEEAPLQPMAFQLWQQEHMPQQQQPGMEGQPGQEQQFGQPDEQQQGSEDDPSATLQGRSDGTEPGEGGGNNGGNPAESYWRLHGDRRQQQEVQKSLRRSPVRQVVEIVLT